MAKKKEIELIARAVIFKGEKILLCKSKGHDYYFLPGGHIEFGETARQALQRELSEELGSGYRSAKSIGILEQTFVQRGKTHHEINFVFLVRLFDTAPHSKEPLIEFEWKDLATADFLPRALKLALKKWREDGKSFGI